MQRFEDFVEEKTFIGDKIKLNDLVDREIIIESYKIDKSKYNDGQCLSLQIVFDNQKRVVFSGSEVIKDQVVKYQEKLPFITTVKKINNYFILT